MQQRAFSCLKGQERPRILFDSVRLLPVILALFYWDRWLVQTGEQGWKSGLIFLFLTLGHRSWRLSICTAQVWGGSIKLSVLVFPLCRVLTRLVRNCLNSEKLHTLFIGLRLVISIFWRAWICFPAHSIQTHQNKCWKCYYNQSNDHWQNNTGIRGTGWRWACIFCILSALRLWSVFRNYCWYWGQ